MLFMKSEMANCLTFWQSSYSSDDFYRSWNLSFDETAFTDDEGKEVTSLVDDLAEAKRHNSTGDIINDADADCISLWDDVYNEEHCNGGPTLAELNGGELTDLEQYEPLRVATKRKRGRNSVTETSHHCASSSGAPVQICNVSDVDCSLQTVQQTNVVADRLMSFDPGFQSDQEKSLSQQNATGLLNPSKPDSKLHSRHSVSVSLSSQAKEDVGDKPEMSANYSKSVLPFSPKHLWKSESADLADDFCASKRMKTNHGAAVTVHPASVSEAEAELMTDVENSADDTQPTDNTLPSSPRFNSSSSFETQKQYFWLYNIQSKGPKCQPTIGRFFSSTSDPHVLSDFSDPAGDARLLTSVNYSGRLRDRGATEVDANPRRLLQIGNELQRMAAIIGPTPPTMAAVEFSLSPREKNKFASRVCRLKRKAQHEANKIKLQGLEQEHRKW